LPNGLQFQIETKICLAALAAKHVGKQSIGYFEVFAITDQLDELFTLLVLLVEVELRKRVFQAQRECRRLQL
jgi:hypothetical protein